MWDVINDRYWGGVIPEPVVTPILAHAMTRRVGGRQRKEDR